MRSIVLILTRGYESYLKVYCDSQIHIKCMYNSGPEFMRNRRFASTKTGVSSISTHTTANQSTSPKPNLLTHTYYLYA